MKRSSKLSLLSAALIATATIHAPGSIWAQGGPATGIDIPQTRMVPIGSPSAVDRYRSTAAAGNAAAVRETSSYSVRETATRQSSAVQPAGGMLTGNIAVEPNPFDSRIQQTAMQQFDLPQLPPDSAAPRNVGVPPSTTPTMPPSSATNNAVPNAGYPSTGYPSTGYPSTGYPNYPSTGVPNGGQVNNGQFNGGQIGGAPVGTPRSLPSGPSVYSPGSVSGLTPVPSSSDLSPLAQPQLGSGFATLDNCNCISPPSTYSAASVYSPGNCAPVSYQAPATYIAPPAQVPAPAVLPGGFVAPPTTAAPAGALVTFGQEAYPVQVGQGLFGQPKAYVPGQNIRNWLRYFTP